jgi:hypothetical protein
MTLLGDDRDVETDRKAVLGCSLNETVTDHSVPDHDEPSLR